VSDDHDAAAPTDPLTAAEQRFRALTAAIREHAGRAPDPGTPERAAWSAEWDRLWAEQQDVALEIDRLRAE